MIEEIFKDIFFTSVFGTALAALLLILRPLTRKFFESSWHYYMWLVVLIVMIFPVKFNFPEKHIEAPEVAVKIIEEETENYKLVPGDNIESAFLPEEKEKIEYFAPVKAFALNNIELFSYIWIFGAAAMLLIKLTGYIIFLKRILKRGCTL